MAPGPGPQGGTDRIEEAAKARSIVESFQAVHGPVVLFDAPMVLLQMVVEIAVRPV
jgi:hypothetical protein